MLSGAYLQTESVCSAVPSFFWRSFPQSHSPQQSLITNFWPSAPTDIDAAYENPRSDRIFLFKGRQTSSMSQEHSPSLIHGHEQQTFVSLLSVIPAGRRVWAYNGYTPVQGYPKKLSSFGLPRGVRKIDAALHDVSSGKTFFFVGRYYFT